MTSVTFSRRDLIGTAAAWGAWSALSALAVPETKPVLRFGLMTDTHVGPLPLCRHAGVRVGRRLARLALCHDYGIVKDAKFRDK